MAFPFTGSNQLTFKFILAELSEYSLCSMLFYILSPDGAQLSTSCPDSAHSDSSFGSTGSGGAEVTSRRNSGAATFRPPQGGSGVDVCM